MRPSIAAALSTLGPIHSAAAVLLTPEDVDRFADVEGPDEGNRRVIERPDDSLLLVVEFDAPTFDQMSYAFVGAVPKDAWTWADPKKRQPAPLAHVNLDARDIHCLTQGGEIHRGATVGTTTDGRAALQAATRPLTFAGIDLRPSMQAFPGFWAAALSTIAAERMNATGRTPIAARTPKDGDTIASFRDLAEIDALPEGAQFVGPTHDPADPGGPGYIPLTKGADGRWHGLRTPLTSAAVSMLSGRTLVLPVTKRTPKDGDRLDSFTAAELDGLPVGARFDDNNGGLSPLVKGPHGWSRAGAAGFCTSADMRSLGLESRTLVLPKPAEAPKPAASPKVGDRWGSLTPEQRASLLPGTAMYRMCSGKQAIAVLGLLWHVIYDGETREVPAEDLAEDNVILSLPVSLPPAPSPKVGDRWGALNDDQRAALPAGTVLDGTGSLPPVVKVGSGWVCVEDGGKVGGFVPERTIAFLPVSK